MATGKKPDPRRKRYVAPHSSYLKVEPAKKIGAYLAGELYGCYAHRTFATQPCVANITDDAMTCPYCESGMIPEWRGWVPLWDCDWTLRHVLIGEEYFESVNSIPHRAKVSVSRAKNPISPLVIREEPMLTRELPASCPWNAAVPMLLVCLTLWKNPQLSKWCDDHQLLAMGAPKVDAMKAAKPLKMPPTIHPQTKQFVAAGQGEVELTPVLEGTLNRVKALEQAGKIVPNGEHPK